MRGRNGLARLVVVTALLAGCTDPSDGTGAVEDEPVATYGPETGDDVLITSERRYINVTTFADVHGIGVDAERPDHLYVATHHGLVRITNGTTMERVGSHSDDYMGFTIHPTQGGTFWVSGHPFRGGNMGVRYSEDGGFTWSTLALKGVDFHALAVSDADPDRLYGSYRGALYRSVDGGLHWAVPSDLPLPVSVLAPHPGDADTIYLAGTQGVAVSTDAGKGWTTVWDRPTATLGLDPHDTSRWYASFPEGLHVSHDDGSTWSRLDLALSQDSVGYLAFDRTAPGTLYAATYRTALYRTTDGGANWDTIKGPA